jgi:hypothetical protein
MTVELEALVGNLYVVGGRAVSAAPPGALVQQAPRRSPRARAQDVFFALLDIDGRSRAPAALYEQLVRVAADTYFQSKGTVTTGIREAVNAVNEALMAHNQSGGAAYQAHLVCAAQRGGEIFVARAGACLSYLQQSGRIDRFPADLAELDSTPLGRRSDPHIALNRYIIAPGDMLTLANRSLADLDNGEINAALSITGAADVVARLKRLVTSAGAALAVEFVVPEQRATAEAAQSQQVTSDRTPESGKSRMPQVNLPKVDVGAAARKVGRGVALGVARTAEVGNRLLDMFFPEPKDDEEPGIRIPIGIAAGLTVIIAFVVAVAGVGLLLRNYGRDRCQDFIDILENDAAQARNLIGYPEQARITWDGVERRAEQAVEVCPPSDERPLDMLKEARDYIDQYDRVVRPRPAVTRLRSFPEGAVLHGPVLHDPDIYVLDEANMAIYRDQLVEQEDGSFKLADTDSKPVLVVGNTVDTYTIERLVDIEWMDEGTDRIRNMLVTLEPTQGVLIAYSPSVPPFATALPGPENWVDPIAIYPWGGRLYILDPAADQIWRYVVSSQTGSYTDAPEPYFDEVVTRPDLEGAIDFVIDEPGNVYILFSDGRVEKYRGGQRQDDFSLETLPVELREVRSLHIDSSRFAQDLYLVDAGNESIFQTTLAGNFAEHYKASNESAFEDLRGVCVKPSTNLTYALANDGLFFFNKPAETQ